MMTHEWTVSAQEQGQKLLTFLTHQLQGQLSTRAIKRLIDSNCCQLNGRTDHFSSTLLSLGDHIVLKIPEEKQHLPKFFEFSRLLFEDEYLLVYNKPAFINSDEQGIIRLLQSYYPSLILVHRLDRETTGVLLFAKNQSIFKAFVQQFKQQQVFKQYQALVDGIISHKKGRIENALGKKRQVDGQSYWGSISSSQGLHALTEWQRKKTGAQATLVTCWPKTGRTHQLRVHFAEMGHPILGDFHYSQQFRCTYRPNRILLHAEKMTFCHPVTHQTITICASLPEDFILAEQKLFT